MPIYYVLHTTKNKFGLVLKISKNATFEGTGDEILSVVHTKPYIESKAFLYSGTQTQGFSRFKINMVGIQKIVTRRLRIQA